MKSYQITLLGQTFVVEILDDPRGDKVRVRVNGEPMTVVVRDFNASQDRQSSVEHAIKAPTKEQSPAYQPPPPLASPSNSQLSSPLPGTILDVFVQPGQKVQTGDELLIIEAMKMNNRIRSPRNGTVGQILVNPQQQVSHGEALLTWQ